MNHNLQLWNQSSNPIKNLDIYRHLYTFIDIYRLLNYWNNHGDLGIPKFSVDYCHSVERFSVERGSVTGFKASLSSPWASSPESWGFPPYFMGWEVFFDGSIEQKGYFGGMLVQYIVYFHIYIYIWYCLYDIQCEAHELCFFALVCHE